MMQMCQMMQNISIRQSQPLHLLHEVLSASLVSSSPSLLLLFFPPRFNPKCTFLSCFFWWLWHSYELVQWTKLSQSDQISARMGTREESGPRQVSGLPLLRVMSCFTSSGLLSFTEELPTNLWGNAKLKGKKSSTSLCIIQQKLSWNRSFPKLSEN